MEVPAAVQYAPRVPPVSCAFQQHHPPHLVRNARLPLKNIASPSAFVNTKWQKRRLRSVRHAAGELQGANSACTRAARRRRSTFASSRVPVTSCLSSPTGDVGALRIDTVESDAEFKATAQLRAMAFYNLPASPSVQMMMELRKRVESEVGRTAMMDLLGLEIVSLMAWCACPPEGSEANASSNNGRSAAADGASRKGPGCEGANGMAAAGVDATTSTGCLGEREPLADVTDGPLRQAANTSGAGSWPIRSPCDLLVRGGAPSTHAGECAATPSAPIPGGKAIGGDGGERNGAVEGATAGDDGSRRQHKVLNGSGTHADNSPPTRRLPHQLLDTAAYVALVARRAAAAVERWWWLEEATRALEPDPGVQFLWGSSGVEGDGDGEQQLRQEQLYQSIQLARTAYRVAERYVEQARDVMCQGHWRGHAASLPRAVGKLGVEDRQEEGNDGAGEPFFLPVLVPGMAAARRSNNGEGLGAGSVGGEAGNGARSPMEKLLFQPPPLRCGPADSLVLGTLDITVGSSLPGAGLVGRYPEEMPSDGNGSAWQGSPFAVTRGGHDRRRAYIFNVCVAPLFRRQGVGMQLMAHARAVAASLGVTVLYVHAEAANAGAVELYRRSGFELESEESEATAQRLGRERRILLRCFLDGSQGNGSSKPAITSTC